MSDEFWILGSPEPIIETLLEPMPDFATGSDAKRKNVARILEGFCPSLSCHSPLDRDKSRKVWMTLESDPARAYAVTMYECRGCDWWFGTVTVNGVIEGCACPRQWLEKKT